MVRAQTIRAQTIRAQTIRAQTIRAQTIRATWSTIGLLAAALLTSIAVAAQSAVTVTVRPGTPGTTIPAGFNGLSFETADILPKTNGEYMFRADNAPLIALFKTLGIKSLRIGGNTADRPTVKTPARADIDSLFAFAHAAGVRVIYTLRLRGSSPADVVESAKYLAEHYQADIDCLSIGNEPNIYFPTYPQYHEALTKYIDAISAVPHGADIKFCGPSTTPGKAEWARGFASDFSHSARIRWVTQHSYPGGSGRKVQDVEAARHQILSTDFQNSYTGFYDLFAPYVFHAGLAYRIEETNNFFNGGAKDVSDTFASSLWGLDYLYWWAAHKAEGINFHTGDNVAAGEQQTPCRYAVFWTSAAGYSVRPLGYAIKAFDLGSHGQLLATSIANNKDKVSLSAYGVLANDKGLFVTLVNKEPGPGGHDAEITIATDKAYSRGEVMFLAAPKADIAAQAGILLGDAPMNDDGSWNGKWSTLPKPGKKGSFTVHLPRATAAVLRLTVQ